MLTAEEISRHLLENDPAEETVDIEPTKRLCSFAESRTKEPYIGVDLDGTLAVDTGWKGKRHIGRPIPKMVRRIKNWLQRGKKVKIFTARASDKSAIPFIKTWLEKQGLGKLEITNKKDPMMTAMYDDKAIKVNKNTGEIE